MRIISGNMLSFSHAMLAAGANTYLGALWEAYDLATMLHMAIFHVCVFSPNEGASLASLWRDSTAILYGITTEEAIFWLTKFISIWELLQRRRLTL
jgi:hypothetical protein